MMVGYRKKGSRFFRLRSAFGYCCSSFAYNPPSPSKVQADNELAKDNFLDPKLNITNKQAPGWFMSGIALAVGGRWIWKGMFTKTIQVIQPFETSNILRGDSHTQNKLNIAQGFKGALDSIYRLAQLDPAHRITLLAYLGSGTLGFFAGNVIQGTQETWVRRQEIMRLINSLQDVLAQSIRSKQQFDDRLREETRSEILKILEWKNISDPKRFVHVVPTAFGSHPAAKQVLQPDDPAQRVKLQKGILLALGMLTGTVLHLLGQILKTTMKAGRLKALRPCMRMCTSKIERHGGSTE